MSNQQERIQAADSALAQCRQQADAEVERYLVELSGSDTEADAGSHHKAEERRAELYQRCDAAHEDAISRCGDGE
jgi:hypothetical protein